MRRIGKQHRNKAPENTVRKQPNDSTVVSDSQRSQGTGANTGEGPVPDSVIADVVAKAVDRARSQDISAEAALRAAMEVLSVAQKSTLDLLLNTAKAQAEIVHELLAAVGRTKPRFLGTELGGLLVETVKCGAGIANSVTAGVMGLLDAAIGPRPATAPKGPRVRRQAVPAATNGTIEFPSIQQQPEQTSAGHSSSVHDVPEAPAVQQPAPKAEPSATPELLDLVLRTIAEGYSAGRPGANVAGELCARYPAAVPIMQEYLTLEDFLVLMWLRQQPALAEVAKEDQFPRFYAELKRALLG